MGYIREPKGVDFIVAPSALTEKDRQEISAFIANYRKDKSSVTILAEAGIKNKHKRSIAGKR